MLGNWQTSLPLLSRTRSLLDGYQDDLRHSAWKEDRICGGGDMIFYKEEKIGVEGGKCLFCRKKCAENRAF